MDALVVGAGPAGSATAALLARAGVRVALLDRAAFPRDKACSEYMSPEAVRLLDRLGVVPALEASGAVALEGTAVTAAMGARLHGAFARAGHRPFRPTGLSVARRVLDLALVRAAQQAGAELLERTVVEELLYREGAVAGAVVRERDGRRRALPARLTVGADGLRSIVARRLGPRRHGRPRRVAFVAHLDGVSGMGASAEMHVSREGYVGLNPIGGGRTNVALVVPAALAAAARGRVEAFFAERLAGFPEVAARVAGATLARRVLATGPFAAWSGRVTADGAALVGDAADFFDPFTGEGIYCALRGAELLARSAIPALERPDAVTAARLAGYPRARRAAFAGKWAVERLVGYGMCFPRLFDRAVARLGRRAGMADTFIGVTGDFVPARAVLNPLFLARMVL
ncbi:MAG TPA: NAD(P)/FAD-dependent oxidoreductase [Gemmatimonadales bacterium]|nr:NAD(P)/FAD-dependent oxidoreductase [Gemmatimonadales bacterium]